MLVIGLSILSIRPYIFKTYDFDNFASLFLGLLLVINGVIISSSNTLLITATELNLSAFQKGIIRLTIKEIIISENKIVFKFCDFDNIEIDGLIIKVGKARKIRNYFIENSILPNDNITIQCI